MAGKETPALYCWSWRVGELRIYAASSKKGAFRIGLSLRDEGNGCDYFEARGFAERLDQNRDENKALISAVEAVLCNRAIQKGLPMDLHGTPFQRKAWETIAGIPFGETRTYGEVAAMVGKRGGARAVGQAMGRNPLPLIFP